MKLKQIEIGEMPVVNLQSNCDLIQYGYTESATLEKVGPKFLRGTDIKTGRIKWDTVPYCRIEYSDYKKYKLNLGDIVITRMGSPGDSAVIEKNIDAVFASYLIRIKVNKSFDPKYVFYFLQSNKYKSYIESIVSTSVQPGANAKQLTDVMICCPDKVNQQRISKILSDLDDKIELNHQMNKTLESIAQAIFKRWFVDFEFPGHEKTKIVDGLPEGWEVKKLVDHVPIIKTGVERFDGEKAYYSTGSISDNEMIPEGKFSFRNRPARANRLVLERDVVQARMRETQKAVLIDKNLKGSLLSTGFLQFRPEDNNYNSKLFYYYLRSDRFLKQRDECASGSTQVALTDEGAEKIDLVVPPQEQQKRIADKLDVLLTKFTDAQSRLDKIPTILSRFRQSVLAAAFSGELTKEWSKKNKIDTEWQESELGGVLAGLKYGTAKKCSREIKKHPVLRIPNVVQGYIDLTDLKYADLEKKEYESLRLGIGDILLIRSNGSVSLVGRTALATEKEKGMAYAGYLIRLRVNKNLIIPEFLQYQFQSYAMRLQIELPARSTSGVNNINSEEVKKLHIALPSLDEQKEVVRRLKASFAFLEKNEQGFSKAKSYTDKLEQSILAKAFRGELVS